MPSILETINTPADVKKLSRKQLDILTQEIRETIIDVTSKNGGHIGPNLGVVELTVALHRLFDFPNDMVTFDVSHQGYVHKLLTGRQGRRFDSLRKTGGVSGFLSREESAYDNYGAGHAGTALSAALGMAKGRDLKGTNEHVISVIGDAALTCGITMEALNNVASQTKKLIVILNDNEWSIAKNVGAIAKYLNEFITNPAYNRLHEDLESFLKMIPGGESIIRMGSKAKQETKDLIVPSSLFEKYGLRYIGPIDGHDLDVLNKYLEFAKASKDPVVLHVLTKKGNGYDVAMANPEKFHGTGAFDRKTGESIKKMNAAPAYQDIFGETLTKCAIANDKIIGITAAMPSGTGLSKFAKACPAQFVDVGIAEEHAVLFAAGLATQGFKPVCAIYSTFLQRAYDCIIHDVCLQDLDVLFCMDRAGLSPNDGPTHHGLFDISYLRCVPRVVLMQPKDEDEHVDMIHTGLEYIGPCFIRYPRGEAEGVEIKEHPRILEIGKAEVLREGEDIVIWALGPMVRDAMGIAEHLKLAGVSATVVNARFVKPLDKKLLFEQAREAKMVVTMEDHVVTGGFGSAVLEALQEESISVPVKRLGWPDRFVGHGSSVDSLRHEHGLGRDQMVVTILTALSELRMEELSL